MFLPEADNKTNASPSSQLTCPYYRPASRMWSSLPNNLQTIPCRPIEAADKNTVGTCKETLTQSPCGSLKLPRASRADYSGQAIALHASITGLMRRKMLIFPIKSFELPCVKFTDHGQASQATALPASDTVFRPLLMLIAPADIRLHYLQTQPEGITCRPIQAPAQRTWQVQLAYRRPEGISII